MRRRFVRALFLGGLLALAGPAAARATVPISVTRVPVTRRLPAGFVGLALEYNTIPRWVGPADQPVDPVLVHLIRNLDPTGRVSLRIGGQSTDRAWWPVAGMRRPRGVTYNLGPTWTSAMRRLAQVLDARLLLGINLEADSTRLSHVEADALVKAVGRRYLDALEIGNEPDLYTFTPWYREQAGRVLPWYAHTGVKLFARPADYGPAQFVAEVRRMMAAIPGLPIAGPDVVSSGPWIDAFSDLLTRGSRVSMLDAHAYPLINCVTDPASARYPSIPNLLTLRASRGLLDGVGRFIAQARRDGAQFRVDEMGSISCNGKPGVSNTMASALWVMDALFAMARSGVDGVNLHTYPNSVNGLFDLRSSRGTWTASVHPLYYGALMFAQAAPTGSRLLRTASPGQAQVRSWATLGPDHEVRVLAINVGGATTARIQAPVGYGTRPASVEDLTSPGPAATGGVRLGGRRFGARTSTGVLAAPQLTTARPRGGAYTISVPRAGAALLTLDPRARR